MKDTLKQGIEYTYSIKIDESKTVPALYPESNDFQVMPKVFATGYLVGFIEWTCIQALKPFLDRSNEQTVGTHIDISHIAATPPGIEVTANVRLVKIDRRRLVFEFEAYDEVGLIARGKHERYVINKSKFDGNLKERFNRKDK